ncbi:MAG: tetratricopeptide repeat protein [Deltaproteobacteria bacterium]|nr:tetratricopeptide repeat protein [Deltaproteobacteria bacterium]
MTTWLGRAVLIVAVAATFANAIGNGFVYDDQLVIVDDPAVRLPLSAGFSGLHYRPLRTLSYRLDHAVAGMDPRAFHLSNVLYHGVAVVLVHALLGALGVSPPAALAGALVFALHPVQTDAVSYAAGRRDVLCGLFYALGVVAYLGWRRTPRAATLVLVALAYVLAILAKEMAVTLPLVCLLIDRWTRRRADAPSAAGAFTARRLATLGALAGLGVLALALTYGGHVLHIATARPWHGGSFGANVATVARVWVKYAQLVVWPATLSADYSYDAFPVSTNLLDPRALASFVVLVGLAAVAATRWRRGDAIGLGLAWAAVTLLPVSHLVPFRELLAEHYLYVPMMGIALVAGGLVDGARARWPARRTAVAAAVLVAIGALGARTIVRNRDWRDRVTLWSATVAAAPRCARAQYNLGQAYFERSRLADAERAWLAAAALQPDDVETTRNLGMLYYRLGKHEAAAAKIDAVIAAKPDDGEAYTLAGYIALDRGKPERAREYFDAALARLPAERAEKARGGRERALRAASSGGAAPRTP